MEGCQVNVKTLAFYFWACGRAKHQPASLQPLLEHAEVVLPSASVESLLIFLSGLAHMGPEADLEPLLGLVADTALPMLPEMQPRVRTSAPPPLPPRLLGLGTLCQGAQAANQGMGFARAQGLESG